MDLAGAEAVLVVTDPDEAKAAAVAEENRAAGGKAEGLALGAGNAVAVTRAIVKVASRGWLDILHSHAGIQVSGGLEEASVADTDASSTMNVQAHLVAAKAAMRQMKAQRSGSIIITALN